MSDLRTAGYCALCDAMIERTDEGSCPAGHPAAAVFGHIDVDEGGQLPALPRFNWAAFSLPPVWGVAHGDWAGFFFLPIWLFADSAIQSAGVNAFTGVMAAVVVAATLAFQAFYAKRAYGLAWRRVADKISVDELVRRERVWALVCVPVGLALLGLAVGYHVLAG